MNAHRISSAVGVGLMALAAGPASAQLAFPDTQNSSLLFMAVDSDGTPTSVTIDLAFVLTDFETRGNAQGVFDGTGNRGPRGSMLTEGTVAVWDFRNNTLTVNGTARSGDYRWSDQFGVFANNSQATDTRYAVFAGSTGNYPTYFLSSGSPTAAQMAATNEGTASNQGAPMVTFYGTLGSRGTFGGGSNVNGASPGPIKGALAMVDNVTGSQGWPIANGNLGGNGDWTTNSKWSLLTAAGTATPMHLTQAGEQGTDLFYIDNLGGTFNYSNGVLTWQAAQPIPEPGAWLLAALGAGLLLQWKRRRNAASPANPGADSLPSAHAGMACGGRAFTAAA